jgi:hypothetical protein
MDERAWRLPGPRGFLRDMVAEQRRGRHVTAVLPRVLAEDTEFTDSLAVAILDELASHSPAQRRVYDAGPEASVLDAFSQALVWEDPPATVCDLLDHPDAKDTVAVLVAHDLSERARGELSEFLAAVERQSHAYGTAGRLSIIAIAGRGELPLFPTGTSSDAALTTIWWWGRVARWDVAAHIAGRIQAAGVLGDIRTESIVEVARWDLDLAERLAAAWSGDPADLPPLLSRHGTGSRASPSGASPSPSPGRCLPAQPAGLRPPGEVLAWWDEYLVDSWHDIVSASPRGRTADGSTLDRMLWAAQARVLLPWIEERRSVLLGRVIREMGRVRLEQVLRSKFSPPVTLDSALEIGVLDRVVQMSIGGTGPQLSDISRRLHKARNALAHMRSLSLAEQEGLTAACAFLR